MSLIRKSDQHPVFTAEGCRQVLTELHIDFAESCPEIYNQERASWRFAQQQIDIIASNPAILGSTSAFGCLIGGTNNIRSADSVSHPLFLANHISVLPVIDDFIWRDGFRDAVEAALLLEWPSIVPIVHQDPETRIVTVHCRHSGGIKGRIKKCVCGYPSPQDVLDRLIEFFGEPAFVKYEHVIVENQVRLRVFYDITKDTIEEATETTEEPREAAVDHVSDFRREIIHLAWIASGNV